MDAALKLLLIEKAVTWAQKQLGTRDVIVVMDENTPADVYGENVLAWYLELLIKDRPGAISVEVEIDPDGYVSVAELKTEGPRLQHLWPEDKR